MKEIDHLDKSILRLLSKDGRMSFTEIASQLEVTEKTVRTRYRALVDQGILEVVGVVNPISLGLKVSAIIQLGIEPQQLNDVTNKVMSFKEVRHVSLITGEYQLLIQVNVKTYDDLTTFLKKLNDTPGIRKPNVMVQLEVNKNTFEIY
ncbi:Lrp/AsnC family transcriptional regulator [Alkalihalobacterium alkalinitrilicum]|uniref:Lrp/AsnC family transcriptional regulator n=1 Tax=Alkalihalobacterium alkalinitrilicum TaxID=427920 RepID=UPI0009956C38|nr:Lrp/AsnC family transcriptional regulator [Alkalihalobacterium alkalinitrilicum]